ncbi:hypothetical protein GW17_00035496, partial [Ensete ventricosum]
DIYGTVDFIFGNAAVVLQNCSLWARRPLPMQKNTITAQNRKDPNQNTGISIHACQVVAAADLEPVKANFPTYLGRPWKLYSRVVYMLSYMWDHIDPAGWLEWNGSFALDTLYYGEYMNDGPGSALGKRVAWPGYRVITLPAEAGKFTVGQFIYGSSWLPSTGVAFLAGLAMWNPDMISSATAVHNSQWPRLPPPSHCSAHIIGVGKRIIEVPVTKAKG